MLEFLTVLVGVSKLVVTHGINSSVVTRLGLQFLPLSSQLNAENPSAVMVVEANAPYYHVTCTGNLMTTLWVLTAASCVVRPDGVKVNYDKLMIYGNYMSAKDYMRYYERNPGQDGQSRHVDEIVLHPNYRCCKYDEDNLALIRVRSAFSLSPIVVATQPLRLGQEHHCTVTGYGRQYGDEFDYPENWVESMTVKKQRFRNCEIKKRDFHVTRRCPCIYQAPGKPETLVRARLTICQHFRGGKYEVGHGDLGAGLVCGGKLFGVFIAVLNYTFYDTCHRDTAVDVGAVVTVGACAPAHALVFADTCTHLRWLHKIVGALDERDGHARQCYRMSEQFSKVTAARKQRDSLFVERDAGESLTPGACILLLLIAAAPLLIQ